MSITSEINRLQTAKADLKTAIENKGVTVPSNTKIDGYADLVDSIETGGSAPYIVNPLNGASFGSSAQVGSITYQYQISGETLVDCGLSIMEFSGGRWYGSSSIYPLKKYNRGIDVYLTITSTGLLTLELTRSQSAVNEYEWLTAEPIIVTFHLSNGDMLADYFYPYCNYSCFVKDTNIVLANRLGKKIQDITYNDELLVWNFDEGKYDSAKPLWIKKTETTTWYYKLKFSNGLELKVTGTYPEAHSLFSVEDGKFIHANKLVGKKVYTLDGIATLESCEEVHENVEFYNIITNYHMNLFANNVLTSTSLNNLYPIKDMKFVKTQRQPVFDYTKFSEDWIVGARLNEQPTDVTEYCLNIINLGQ